MVYIIDSISHVTGLGQRVFFEDNDALERAGMPSIARDNFRLLIKEGLNRYAAHSKFLTDGCGPAAAARVALDMTTGVPVDYELKGRMFMAHSVEGEPVIILSFYSADSKANIDRIRKLMPEQDGDSLIHIPRRVRTKKGNGYDILDLAGFTNPFFEAAEALQLGMGMINPFAAMAQAEKLGVKILCLYDERLLRENKPLTTNLGVRDHGIYAEDGREYIQIAIKHAKPIIIDGCEYQGAIVGNIADIDKALCPPPMLGQLYLTVDLYKELGFSEEQIKQAWKRPQFGLIAREI